MRINKLALIAASVIGAVASMVAAPKSPAAPGYAERLDASALKEIRSLYRRLIEAENRHDLAEVRTLVWDSPSTLFVAKTATAAEGNWAGFWGTEAVMRHL